MSVPHIMCQPKSIRHHVRNSLSLLPSQLYKSLMNGLRFHRLPMQCCSSLTSMDELPAPSTANGCTQALIRHLLHHIYRATTYQTTYKGLYIPHRMKQW